MLKNKMVAAGLLLGLSVSVFVTGVGAQSQYKPGVMNTVQADGYIDLGGGMKVYAHKGDSFKYEVSDTGATTIVVGDNSSLTVSVGGNTIALKTGDNITVTVSAAGQAQIAVNSGAAVVNGQTVAAGETATVAVAGAAPTIQSTAPTAPNPNQDLHGNTPSPSSP